MPMNLDDIKQILDLVREHDLAEFELERDGLKVRIRKASAAPVVQYPASVPLPAAPAAVAARAAATPTAQGGAEEAEASEGVDLAIIKSPIVGTLYRAS